MQTDPSGHAECYKVAFSRYTITVKVLLALGVLALSFLEPSSMAQVPVNANSPGRTFLSRDRIVSFTYPGSLALCGKKSEDTFCETYLPICDKSALACVAYRSNKYDGYNFEGAAFSVNKIRELNTYNKCLKSMNSGAKTQLIKGMKYRVSVQKSAGLGHWLSESSYRIFHRKTCYELDLRFETSNIAGYDPGTIKEFTSEDERTVRDILEQALYSFKFLR